MNKVITSVDISLDLKTVENLDQVASKFDMSRNTIIEAAAFRFVYEFVESVRLFTGRNCRAKGSYKPSNFGQLPEFGC